MADQPPQPPDRTPAAHLPVSALLRRITLLNAAVYAVGTTVLALSPATVSAPAALRESAVLAAGVAVMLAANAALLRMALAPLDRLVGLMEHVDLLRPGQRLPEGASGDFAVLARTFNAMLARLETERGASSGQALAAQETERQRIARELHDEIGQSLTVVLLGLKRIADEAPDRLRPDLVIVQEQVRHTLEEVGNVARRLRPGVLDDLGLASAINALVVEFAQHSGVRVERRVDATLPPLPRQAELVLYRVAQEALTNVARHAEASSAEVRLARHPAGVMLRITDNGRGPGAAPTGAGIRGMRERALLISAELTIGARRPGGTEVRLVVPVPPSPVPPPIVPAIRTAEAAE